MKIFPSLAVFSLVLVKLLECQFIGPIPLPLPEVPPACGQPAYCSVVPSSDPTLATCSSTELYDLINTCRSVPFPASYPVTPTWINCTLFTQGQQFFTNHLASVVISNAFGLISVAYPDVAALLYFTGLGFNATLQEKRFLATLAQLMVYQQDIGVCPPNPATSNTIHSLKRVHSIHLASNNAAAAQISQTGSMFPSNLSFPPLTTVLNGPFYEDLDCSSIPQSQRIPSPASWANTSVLAPPLNQQSAGLFQFALAGYITLFPARLACNASDDEIWAFNHMWAAVVAMSGLKDECNIGLQPNMTALRTTYQNVFDTFVVPNTFQSTPLKNALMEVLAGALSNLSSNTLTPNLLLYRYLTDILQVNATNTCAHLSAEELAFNLVLNTQYIPEVESNPDTINTLFNTITYNNGVQMFGPVAYLTVQSRSMYAFFAKFDP